MLAVIKNYIKTKPRLYDILNSMQPISSDVEEWVDNSISPDLFSWL